MRILLDTHAFLWWVADDPALSASARTAIAEPANQVHVSAATAWEITTKYRIGRLPAAGLVAADAAREIAAEGFAELAVTVRHAQHAGAIPGPHKDPFDRILIAQALAEGMTLVSNEALFDGYGVARLW
jgi:PIN domain nuclease of toxin-antitoxin system